LSLLNGQKAKLYGRLICGGRVLRPTDLLMAKLWVRRINDGDMKSQLRVDRCQLGLGGTDQSRLFNRFSGRPGIKSIKNGGAYENREKQGDYIHAYAEK
jgi:hypothetical protein